MTRARIPVHAGDGYLVVVGEGALDELGPFVAAGFAKQAAVIHSPATAGIADEIATALSAESVSVLRVEVPDGEAAKDIAVAQRVWQAMGRAAFTRSDLVVGVGGGSVTDLAGFVAATWLRGVDVVHVPTTLLGMVDAAVGGKTGVNTEAGKNLVGAFHQPRLVVADVSTLNTLSQGDFTAGLAEVVKAGFIADPSILDILETRTAAVIARDAQVVTRLVERAVLVKAVVVGDDPTEQGRRAFLNYGHTLAHAIEHDAGYGVWRHGDAVSVGLCYAAAVARRRRIGALDDLTADRHRAVLESLGLPTHYPADAWPRLRAAMSVDKKNRGSRLRFVVLDAVAKPSMLDDPGERLLESAYEEVAG
jgi:3-dehydroquinate synthase